MWVSSLWLSWSLFWSLFWLVIHGLYFEGYYIPCLHTARPFWLAHFFGLGTGPSLRQCRAVEAGGTTTTVIEVITVAGILDETRMPIGLAVVVGAAAHPHKDAVPPADPLRVHRPPVRLPGSARLIDWNGS